MRNIRLLIADHSEKFVNDVKSFLGRMPGIDVVGYYRNGDQTVKFISEKAPDAVLLGLVLDGLDGLSILKWFKGKARAPAFIVCTEFTNEVCIHRASQYGACYFLCKPVARHVLYDAIVDSVNAMGLDLTNEVPTIAEVTKSTDEMISNFLASSGIPKQSSGYRYLCDAAAIVGKNPSILSALTKLLYPEIARMNKSTPARVERNIRSAIFHAYRHNNLQINGSRPTNREFIQMLTDQMNESTSSI